MAGETHWRQEIAGFWCVNLGGTDRWEDLDVDDITGGDWASSDRCERAWTRCIWLRMRGCGEHDQGSSFPHEGYSSTS